jgi:exo-1,4-beta-D-glucosaminidase
LGGSTWYHTPVSRFSDYTSLFSTETTVFKASVEGGGGEGYRVVLENKSGVPAVFIRLNLVDGDGEDVNSVTWSDNYVTLWPGEKMELSVHGWDGGGAKVLLDGVNV